MIPSAEWVEQQFDHLGGGFGFFPKPQADPRKEAIRRALMSDVFKVKVVGFCIVAAAALVYLITGSRIAYFGTGISGVMMLHYLGFLWARKYLAEGREARAAIRERRQQRIARRRRARLAVEPSLPLSLQPQVA